MIDSLNLEIEYFPNDVDSYRLLFLTKNKVYNVIKTSPDLDYFLIANDFGFLVKIKSGYCRIFRNERLE